MIKVSELENKEFINIMDGSRLGPIKDMHIDIESGKVEALVLRGSRKVLGRFGPGRDLVVPWQKIRTVGVDTVLVEIETFTAVG